MFVTSSDFASLRKAKPFCTDVTVVANSSLIRGVAVRSGSRLLTKSNVAVQMTEAVPVISTLEFSDGE